jgi:hypothetical protein
MKDLIWKGVLVLDSFGVTNVPRQYRPFRMLSSLVRLPGNRSSTGDIREVPEHKSVPELKDLFRNRLMFRDFSILSVALVGVVFWLQKSMCIRKAHPPLFACASWKNGDITLFLTKASRSSGPELFTTEDGSFVMRYGASFVLVLLKESEFHQTQICFSSAPPAGKCWRLTVCLTNIECL